jgi:hypothetical protein
VEEAGRPVGGARAGRKGAGRVQGGQGGVQVAQALAGAKGDGVAGDLLISKKIGGGETW